MEQPITYSKHENFNFKEARIVALGYANSDVTMSISDFARILSCDRKRISRCLKVSIILQLVSKEEMEKIVNNRYCSYKRYVGTRARDVQTYEKCIELANERLDLVNKMEKMLLMFSSQNQDEIRAKYLPRILEIERYAFR